MRFALALTVAVAGCGGVVTNSPGSPSVAAPGVKRYGSAVSTTRPVGQKRDHARRPSTSRSLRRRPVSARLLTVTGYCYTGSRNAAGNRPTIGTAAANAYPLGARLDVQNVGVVVVEDRSAPGATDLDIYLGSDSGCETRAMAWGRRVLRVTEIR